MPRKKPTENTKPIKTRSRGSCKECRASRVRCDTKKPACTRCRERGLTCSTDLVLKWESDFASRGLAFGRAGVWRKDGSTPSPPASSTLGGDEHAWCVLPHIEKWGFVNSGVGAFERRDWVNVVACEDEVEEILNPVSDSKGLDRRLRKALSTQLSSPAPSLVLFPQVSAPSGHLFEYYVQQVCPRTTASSKKPSPFASIILPFCLSASSTLFSAIQALGACHRSRFDGSYRMVGLRHKAAALKGLRQRLATASVASWATDPELLAVMVMLCLYEIVDNCSRQWTVHLKGAKDFIRLRRRRQQKTLPKSHDAQDSVSAFAELFFAFQDVMGRTACGEEVLFGSDYWAENERTIDLWMGCSPELASILSYITELSRTRRQLDSDSARAQFSLRAASLGTKLETLVQEVPNGEDNTLQSAAEMKRLAAVLYLHCALCGASPTTPLVASYVRRILRLVSDLLDSGSFVSMTWPVFVAAVELDPAQDELWPEYSQHAAAYGRPLVLRALATMAESTVSNVTRTRAVIAKVWQARDGDMAKGPLLDASGMSANCNDWEWYVAPISTAMSLA
ncbi:C6 zinc finger domain protein [Aspergillus taichungensis]|uniref:C6 zinc finger domain protein n=1 Tax=Aspergillus taichungensis TaxID=482145 RepID=A0A2J5HWY1_9EURO|nr:C6 zinc finger domain protein [Aspergillus taichungensis]